MVEWSLEKQIRLGYMRNETNTKTYKATVRPIMAYTLETRAET